MGIRRPARRSSYRSRSSSMTSEEIARFATVAPKLLFTCFRCYNYSLIAVRSMAYRSIRS